MDPMAGNESMQIKKMECSGCGAPINIVYGRHKTVCSYCGAVYQISEKKDNVSLPANAIGNNPLDWEIVRIEPKKIDISILEQKNQSGVIKKYDIASSVDDMICFFSTLSILTENPYEVDFVNTLDKIRKYSDNNGRTIVEPDHIYSYSKYGLDESSDPDPLKSYSEGRNAQSEIYNKKSQHEINQKQREGLDTLWKRYGFQVNEERIIEKSGSSTYYKGPFRLMKINRTWYVESVEQKAQLVINPLNAKNYLHETDIRNMKVLKEKDYTRTVITQGIEFLLRRNGLKMLFDSSGIGPGYIDYDSDNGYKYHFNHKDYLGADQPEWKYSGTRDPLWRFSGYGMKDLEDSRVLNLLMAVIIAGIFDGIPEEGTRDYYLRSYRKELCGYIGSSEHLMSETDIGYSVKKVPVYEDWV